MGNFSRTSGLNIVSFLAPLREDFLLKNLCTKKVHIDISHTLEF